MPTDRTLDWDAYYSNADLKARYGIEPEELDAAVKAGILPGADVGPGKMLFHGFAIHQWLKAGGNSKIRETSDYARF